MSETESEFNREEWREIAQAIKPELSDEDFERMWNEFQAMKSEVLELEHLYNS